MSVGRITHQDSHLAWVRRLALAGSGVIAMGAAIGAPLSASASGGKTIFVHPGESIQAAVDNAAAGDTVKVLAGTYHQQVNISTSNITLKGEGPSDTIIEPPAATGGNCDTALGPTGICVGISPIAEGGPATGILKGVSIRSLTVTGFAGSGLFLLGTDGARVENVHATNDGFYGIFFNTSTNGVINHNLTAGNNEAGIYYGDSPDADGWITDNTSLDNHGSGIFFRDSKEGHITGNKTQGNCEGIFVLNTGYGQGLSNTSDVVISDNEADSNNANCPAGDHGTALSGLGIVLVGASNVKVTDNSVEHNNAGSNATVATAGIAIVSSVPFGGTAESNIKVTDNEVEHNAIDLLWDGSGSGVSFDDNDCDTSQPPGLC